MRLCECVPQKHKQRLRLPRCYESPPESWRPAPSPSTSLLSGSRYEVPQPLREHPRGGKSPPFHTQHSKAAGRRVAQAPTTAQAGHGQLQRREQPQAGAQGTGSHVTPVLRPPGMASRIDKPKFSRSYSSQHL